MPPRPIFGDFAVHYQHVDINVVDQVARVQVSQAFSNTSGRTMEVEYFFPLPENAAGFQDKWPCAFDLIRRINFTNTQIAEAAANVDVDGREPGEAAAQWIEDNQEVWKGWIPACAS